MARKKRTRARRTRRIVKRARTQSPAVNIKKRIMMAVNSLLLFIALSLVSYVLYIYFPQFVQNVFITNFFLVISMVFGFVSVGFLIELIILFIMKSVSKKR